MTGIGDHSGRVAPKLGSTRPPSALLDGALRIGVSTDTLPRSSENLSRGRVSDAAAVLEAPATQLNSLRVLVVEDDILIGSLLAEMLEELGLSVCAVEVNALNAIAAAVRFHPDLMIVDIGLSEGSGIAAVEEIIRCGFVPHVFVTGDVLRDLALGPGAVLIQKPFREPEILAAIQRALNAAPR